MINRELALKIIFEYHNNKRIEGAIFLAKHAIEADALSLLDALDNEPAPEIQFHLRQAVLRAIGGDTITTLDITKELKEFVDPQENKIIENVAHSILHEISPLIGRLGVVMEQEVPDYDLSRSSNFFQRLNSELNAIRTLYTAVQLPVFAETDFYGLTQNVLNSLECPASVDVMLAGQSPFVVISDSSLIEVVISNGLRNAIEATDKGNSEEKRVVLNWGDTDKDYWFVIFDAGSGSISEILRKITRQSTSKTRGHGLRLASKSATSLSGSIVLSDRIGGGIKFEFRWPKQGVDL